MAEMVSLLGEPAHPIPDCGCSPFSFCAEGRRLSRVANALIPTRVLSTDPAAVQEYQVWDRALDRLWAHTRPDNPNARREWTQYLIRSGM